MSFITPYSSSGPCTPVVPVIIDCGASGTQGHQSPDHQSQWLDDGIGFGASVRLRSQTRFFWGHDVDISDVVASASERLLEENAFYMRLKLIVRERMAELNELQETVANQRKEIEALKIRCDTYREMIDLFAKNGITLKTASGDTTPVVNLPPTADMKKGVTDGGSSTARAKAKPGRPCQDSYEDTISEYIYLQNSDGTLVSKEVISRMSQKAQAIWEVLDEHGLAPATFDKISDIAWDFYARSMLSDPEFFFLRLCDDGQWKLKEWSNSSRAYSSWYSNRGVRQKKAMKSNNSILDVTNPTQLDWTNKTNNKIDLDDGDPGNGGDENGSEVNCRSDDSYEGHNTETPYPTSNSEKKRKTEGKVASRSLKKQEEAETLAIPTDRNTIRNICMHHWNELQPGGQGLASEFDAYFKTLSDTDKEPFKREKRAVPIATRKARTAAKKVGDTALN